MENVERGDGKDGQEEEVKGGEGRSASGINIFLNDGRNLDLGALGTRDCSICIKNKKNNNENITRCSDQSGV